MKNLIKEFLMKKDVRNTTALTALVAVVIGAGDPWL
jgi:hypothetical protein